MTLLRTILPHYLIRVDPDGERNWKLVKGNSNSVNARNNNDSKFVVEIIVVLGCQRLLWLTEVHPVNE